MILNGRNSNFILKLPVGFIPKVVADHYEAYANSAHYPYLSVAHMVESTLQGVTIPGLTQETVAQTRQQSMQTYKGAKPVNAGYDKTLTLTFKLIDGYVNWSCLHQSIDEQTQIFESGQPLYWKDLRLYSLDRFGNVVNMFTFNRIVFTSLEGLNPSYANVSPDFQTFTMSFTYNIFDLEFKPILSNEKKKILTVGSGLVYHPPIGGGSFKNLNDYSPIEILNGYTQVQQLRDLLLNNLRYQMFVIEITGAQHLMIDPSFNPQSVQLTINGIEQIDPIYAMADGMLFLGEDMQLFTGDIVEVKYMVLN